MGVLPDSVSVPRSVSAAAVSLFGISLSGVHGHHILTGETASLATVLGGLFPLFLSLGLAAAGPLLYRSRLNEASVAIAAGWSFAVGFAIGVLSALIVTHQLLKGAPLHGPLYLGATAVTGGALLGLVAGRYDASNRQRAALVESLQEATADLSEATTRSDVCERAVNIANRVLDIPLTGVWLYDETEEALVPAAVAEPAGQFFESPPVYRPGESLSWDAFEAGQTERYDDMIEQDDRHNPETVIRSEIIVPLGDLGVMNFGSVQPNRFGSLDVTVAELLATATEAALFRADREEELREQRRRLSEQNERLEAFTSVVSHDLRNPIAVATGRLELARDEIEDDNEDLETVAEALADMESLVDDLLSLAKQGQTVGETERVSLSAVASDAWEYIDEETAVLDVENLEIDADRDRLRQLLENLFANAVAHGDLPVSIRAGPLADGRGFFVADDGPGIDPETREQIFDLGYTDREDGTGFGLAIVRRIAEAHGWNVDVTESDAGGARFEFIIEGDCATA